MDYFITSLEAFFLALVFVAIMSYIAETLIEFVKDKKRKGTKNEN